MLELFSIFFFVFGLIIGSFLNVLIARYQTGLSISGRSFCFSCRHKLSWYELIPIVSFLLQKGRCRSCNSRISWQYPTVELITGILFLFIFLKLDFSFSLHYFLLSTFYFFVFTILLAIAFYDIRHKIIPDAFVYTFIAFSFLNVFRFLSFDNLDLFVLSRIGEAWEFGVWLIAGPILATPFALLWLISRGRWLGLGDAKLTAGIGWLLGLSSGVAALILAFWIGAFVGVILLALNSSTNGIHRLFPRLKRFTMKSEIPFAPFLIFGTFLVFFYDISFADIQSLFMF